MAFFYFVDSSKSQGGILNSGEISRRFCPHCIDRSHVYPQVSIRPPDSPAADHRPYRQSWPRSWEMINDSENSSLTNKRRSLDLALIFNDNLPTPNLHVRAQYQGRRKQGAGQLPLQSLVPIQTKYFPSRCLGSLLGPPLVFQGFLRPWVQAS